jgi:hypothetical protein
LRWSLGAALWLLLWTPPAFGQVSLVAAGPRLAPTWESWEHSPAVTSTEPGTTQRERLSRSARWAVGGAIVGGVLAAAVANAVCERDSGCTGPTLKWALIGAAVGAAVGGLIGAGGER